MCDETPVKLSSLILQGFLLLTCTTFLTHGGCPPFSIYNGMDYYLNQDLICSSNTTVVVELYEDCPIGKPIFLLEDGATLETTCLYDGSNPYVEDTDAIAPNTFGMANVRDVEDASYQFVLCTDLIKSKDNVMYNIRFDSVDVNEYPPQPADDLNDVQNVETDENNVEGAEIYVFSFTDPDTSEIPTLEVIPNFAETTFRITEKETGGSSKTFSIIALQQLDFETSSFYSLEMTVESVDVRGTKSSVEQQFLIYVQDVGDTAPFFLTRVPVVDLPEGEARDDVFQVEARDGDYIIDNTIAYSIISGNDDGFFNINNMTGWVSLVKDIDRETLTELTFVLEIMAQEVKEDGTPVDETPNSNTQQTNVNILDVNNKIPTFNLPLYYQQTSEVDSNQIQQVKLEMTFTVEDFDEGLSGSFNLTTDNENVIVIPPSGSQAQEFQIYLQPSDDFDYELQLAGPIIIILTATELENSSHTSTSILNITLIDINDNSPLFSNETFSESVAETVEVGYSLMTVKATDKDVSQQFGEESIIYTLTQCDDFSIDSRTGEIEVSSKLDYESDVAFTCRVKAQDMYANATESLYSTALIQITIIDINDETPQITQVDNEVSLSEDVVVLTNISTVRVVDQDNDAVLEVYIQYDPNELNEVKGWFELIETSTGSPANVFEGVVQTKSLIDRETKSHISLNIIAKDLSSAPSQENFEIISVTLIDVNDEYPEFSSDYSTQTFIEELSINTEVFVVEAEDKDVNDVIVYGISDPSGTLAINSTTGYVSVQQRVDRDGNDATPGTSQINVNITATDLVDHVTLQAVLITILDKNDNAPILDELICNKINHVMENSTDDLLITTLSASDMDEGEHAEIVYSIIYPSFVPFRIDAVTGEMFVDTTEETLDREIISSYNLTVRASDQCLTVNDPDPGCKPLQDTCHVIIIVEDVNDNWPSESFATCNDQTCTIITTEEALEQGDEISGLEILAFDEDEPDNPNSKLTFTVFEMTFSTNDSLVDPILFEAQNKERLNPSTNTTDFYCTLLATQNLNFLRENYQVEIQVCDAGNKCTNTIFPLQILDSNDHIPLFTFSTCLSDANQVVYMEEETNPIDEPLPCITNSTDLATFTLVDDDLDQNAFVELLISQENSEMVQGPPEGGDGQMSAFDVVRVPSASSNIYNLIARDRIDREKGVKYNLSLVASDNGEPQQTSESWVFIIVNDISEFKPLFANPEQQLMVTENSNASMAFFPATDKDNDNQDPENMADIYYTIYGSRGADNNLFEIKDPKKAEVSAKDDGLDREAQEVYHVEILASNTGSDLNPEEDQVLKATVIALDMNDESPVYDGLIDGAFLPTAEIGYIVATFKFTDLDSSDSLDYIIEDNQFNWSNNQDFADSFILQNVPTQKDECEILLNMNAAKATGYCRFTIRATDEAGHTSTAPVQVFVITDNYLVTFIFQNTVDEVEDQEAAIDSILEDIFNYTCVIDGIMPNKDESNNEINGQTLLTAHFIREMGSTDKNTKIHDDNFKNKNSDDTKRLSASEGTKNSLNNISNMLKRIKTNDKIKLKDYEHSIKDFNHKNTVQKHTKSYKNERKHNDLSSEISRIAEDRAEISRAAMISRRKVSEILQKKQNGWVIKAETELELVPKSEIEATASSGTVSDDLREAFSNIGLTLIKIGEIDTNVANSDHKTIVTFKILFGIFTLVLGLALLMVAIAYYVKTQKLNRQVKVLSTNTFGSKASGLEIPAASVPGSNVFAVAGSNPLWTALEDEQQERPIQTEGSSVSSGDSALVYLDEYPQFQDKKDLKENFKDAISVSSSGNSSFKDVDLSPGKIGNENFSFGAKNEGGRSRISSAGTTPSNFGSNRTLETIFGSARDTGSALSTFSSVAPTNSHVSLASAPPSVDNSPDFSFA